MTIVLITGTSSFFTGGTCSRQLHPGATRVYFREMSRVRDGYSIRFTAGFIALQVWVNP